MKDRVRSDVTVYHAFSPTTRTLMLVGPLVVVGALLWSASQEGATLSGALSRFAPFLIMGSIIGYVMYRVAHTIVVHEAEGSLEFRTFLGTRTVRVMEIASISPSFLQHGQLVIKHAQGSVAIPGQFAGLHDLVEWIRRANPAVVFKGI